MSLQQEGVPAAADLPGAVRGHCQAGEPGPGGGQDAGQDAKQPIQVPSTTLKMHCTSGRLQAGAVNPALCQVPDTVGETCSHSHDWAAQGSHLRKQPGDGYRDSV